MCIMSTGCNNYLNNKLLKNKNCIYARMRVVFRPQEQAKVCVERSIINQ